MNFRTTLLLLVVLAAAAVMFFTLNRDGGGRDAGKQTQTDGETSGESGKKLFDLTAANVNKVVVTPATGKRIAFERSGASEWRMTEPVNAPAEAYKVDDLVREVLELRTTGREDPSDKGFDKPTFVIEVADKAGKVTKLNVGAHSPVGDILYVRPEGQNEADIVSASIVAQLEKPASEYRKLRLLPSAVTNENITGVTVNEAGKTLKLVKAGHDWQIVEPKTMPGDESQISSLLSAVTGLSAVKFVSEEPKDLARYGLSDPQMTVSFTTAPPATQPTTAATKPAAGETTTVKFGGPQDVFKKNLYAIASDSGPVVTVAATSLDAFRKTPIDLRKRDVLELNADSVSRISITTDKPATTQPTTQPASKATVVLERRSETATPATKPATKPATTGPTTTATTAPSTQPAAPQTKWIVASDPKGDANDTAVQDLLAAMRPLRADKFLQSFPTTQAAPVATYVVKVNTRGWADEPAKEHVLTLTDRGGTGFDAKLLGQLDDLTFELDRTIVEKLTADFAAPKLQPAGPVFPGPAFPPTAPK